VSAGPGRPALLLGPLAVGRHSPGGGLGAALMRRAPPAAAAAGPAAVPLGGAAPYFSRFGFSAAQTRGLWLPGPYERDRLLACELTRGALDGARGLVSATGRPATKPDLAVLVTRLARNDIRPLSRPARAS